MTQSIDIEGNNLSSIKVHLPTDQCDKMFE